MAQISLKMFEMIRKYRWKHKDDEQKQKLLTDLISFSFPVVYGDYLDQLSHCRKEVDKFNKRVARWKRYVSDMIFTFAGKPAYLVTLTFGECYDSTTRESRHKYCKVFLKKVFSDYIGCLDIGAAGREHYHIIGVLNDNVPLSKVEVVSKNGRLKTVLDFSDNAWSFGFSSLSMIRGSDNDLFKATRYAIKASGYASKKSRFDSDIKPFHARGVQHWRMLKADDELPF